MATIQVSGVQYSGIWNISSQANAKAAGTWPSQPVPSLFTWGLNGDGQLGLGNVTNYSSPKQVGVLTNWARVYSGGQSMFAITTTNQLLAFGANYAGALGDGTATGRSSPVQIGTLTTWYAVSSKLYSTAATLC